MTIKKVGIYITIIVLIIIGLNLRLPTKQGIDYKVHVYKIPLYIKLIEFMDRDYRYRELATNITKDTKSDRDKAIAILKWVSSNIKTNIPREWPIYDDHIWHIIIRGYGKSDQMAAVFTTLSMYSGLPAGWERMTAADGEKKLVLSFVKIDSKWRLFDVFRNVYLINDDGDIATVEDIISGRYENGSMGKLGDTGLRYEDYLKDVERYLGDIASRPRRQMPFRRVAYEIKSLFRREGIKENERMPNMQ